MGGQLVTWETLPPVEGPADEPFSAPPNWDDPPDTPEANRAVSFIQSCPHTKGDLQESGKTLGDTWLPWQDRLTRHVFGEVDDDGHRRYRHVYAEMPKKSGKSHWLAAAMIYLLGPATKTGAELYSAAYDHGQAMVVWGIAQKMCKYAGWIGEKVGARSYQGCWELENPKTDSLYTPLTRKAASKHGINPYAVAFDELHEQPDATLWDTLDQSMGAWEEPLMVAITNSGHDRDSLCYRKREYAVQNNESGFDDGFLGVVYGLGEGHEGVGGPEEWRRANPGVPVTVDLETVERKAATAERQPSELNTFQRWQLGIWTRSITRWISPDDWDDCERPYEPADLKGGPSYGGLDIGSRSDLTAWVLLFPDEDDSEVVRVLCRVWCPSSLLKPENNRHADQYAAWAREGWLNVTPGRSVDYWSVREQVAADAERFGLVDMGVDTQFQGAQLMMELAEDHGIAVAGMRTTFTHMTAPCDEFERRILLDPEMGGPKVLHNANPVLTWAVRNTALKQPDPDRKRPVKDSEEAKIDPVVALLMALDRAMRHEGPSTSPYEDEDHELFVL